ncbi:unnamed protein product [Rotaria sp. Silwood2]|nr:unnamed protein product [Rotaria sp. Silwood2]CAF4480661.1 unnamed protein product [Rotaria sp. Silwood2]
MSAGAKLLLNHWIYQWLLACAPSDSYIRMLMFYVFICTGTHLADTHAAIVGLVTCNKYTLLSYNNAPFLSQSIRKFWGCRYNQLVGSVLKESVFEPTRRLLHSSTIAVLTTFTLSGLLHAHVAVAVFGASSPVSAFTFFFLQGIACCVENLCSLTLPKPIGIVTTHIFLLLTAPLYIGLFTRAGPAFFALNPPPLFGGKWIPQLPLPNFFPK